MQNQITNKNAAREAGQWSVVGNAIHRGNVLIAQIEPLTGDNERREMIAALCEVPQKKAIIAATEALAGLVGFLREYPHQFAVDIEGYIEAAESAIDTATPLTR